VSKSSKYRWHYELYNTMRSVSSKVNCKCTKLTFFSCLACLAPLGMENGRITSAQLTASSQWDGNHSPNRARLNIPANGNYRGAWAVAPDQINQNQWIQVDLRIKTRITYVATQGRADAVQWLKKYRLQFGDDGSSFEGFKQDGESVDQVGLSCDKREKRIRKPIPRYVLWLAPLKVFGGKDARN